MSDHTARGQADHRAVEIFERCAQVATQLTDDASTIYRFEAEAMEVIILDAAKRFWERRGYTIPEGVKDGE